VKEKQKEMNKIIIKMKKKCTKTKYLKTDKGRKKKYQN
jgi:hypothetical protein